MTTPTSLGDGVYEWEGWSITVWEGKMFGFWWFRATKGQRHRKEIVLAWDEESAAQEAVRQLED